MPRTKNYNEQEVIEKAMNLFWRNGFETTSMHMLEQEMGINKFSIYASFGNKQGVFLESLRCYKQKLDVLIHRMEQSDLGIASIKNYFYDFIDFSKDFEFGKGCLISNTANELGSDIDAQLKTTLTQYTQSVRNVFKNILQQDSSKSTALINQEADYLIIAMFGLSSATKSFTTQQLHHYIENIFKGL
ncbi:TetR/AcrR family transcriptional regulator [Formosa sp. A9]|uniref:TetR/AcrR family transcriptional regulator n=1 Tax=Formosa sp. A9 TaxID=3442641 RepID=UPI003EBBE8E9